MQNRNKYLMGMLLMSIAALPVASVAADPEFTISEYEVVGNRLIGKEEIGRLVAPYAGTKKVFGDIQKALEAIEAAYRSRGYSGVQIMLPEQELARGVVRFEVIEAVIGDISVKGNAHFTTENILRALPGIEVGQTPNTKDLSERVLLANENPARKIDLVLGVGESANKLDAKIEVKDEAPLMFFVNADNTGNRQTGRDRFGVALQHANMFDRDHVATAAYTTSLAKPESARIFSLSYRLPIYAWGDSLDLIYGYSDVDAGTSTTVAGPLQFSGKGSVLGLRYNQLLSRQGEFRHRFIYGIDQREYDNNCLLGGSPVCGAGGADITVRPLSVTYTGQWDAPEAVTAVLGSLSVNLPGGQHGSQADFTAARLDASRNYSILRGNISHNRVIGSDWQIRATLGFQHTRDALVSGEQFGLAGSTAVRGFEERAVATDKGTLGTVEVYSPQLAGLPGSLRFLGFFDFASGSYNKTAPGTYHRETISSIGAGLRYALGRRANLRFDVARVTNGGPDGTAKAGDWRGHLAVTLGF